MKYDFYYIQVASGRLLTKWHAHYRAVTCLLFSDDESLLISGAEDGCVRVWSLFMYLHVFVLIFHQISFGFLFVWLIIMKLSSDYIWIRVFDDLRREDAGPLYEHSFSEHTLRVTDIVTGYGGSNAIIVSASEDRTCKVCFCFHSHTYVILWYPVQCGKNGWITAIDWKVSFRSCIILFIYLGMTWFKIYKFWAGNLLWYCEDAEKLL